MHLFPPPQPPSLPPGPHCGHDGRTEDQQPGIIQLGHTNCILRRRLPSAARYVRNRHKIWVYCSGLYAIYFLADIVRQRRQPYPLGRTILKVLGASRNKDGKCQKVGAISHMWKIKKHVSLIIHARSSPGSIRRSNFFSSFVLAFSTFAAFTNERETHWQRSNS